MSLSVVVPVFDEEDNVGPLYERIVNALDESLDFEIVFVDDGSSDETFSRLEAIAGSDQRVRVVKFRRNYGQTPAMVAGIDHARGNVIVTMDGDLQNDPADIPRFLESIDQGYDIVVGWRQKRQDKLITRKVPSWIANRLIGRITGVPIKDNGCSLKAYRASVIKGIPLYSEMHRFIPAMASMAGSRILEIPVQHHPRIHGESKYGLKRIYKVIMDLVVVRTLLSTLGRPLKYFATLGAAVFVIAGIFVGLMITSMIRGEASMVFLACALLWTYLFGSLLLSGILAELLYKVTRHKESYLAKLTTHIDA